MEPLDDPKMPHSVRPYASEIMAITDKVCLEHLDTEYAQLCRRVIGKLARKRPTPLIRGDVRIWAGGVLYAVGQLNFLFDPAEAMHLSADQLSDLLGVKKTTMANKAKLLRDLIKLDRFDLEFTSKKIQESNPLTWMVLIDGMPVDVRRLPVEIQRRIFEHGLIPYVPGEDANHD